MNVILLENIGRLGKIGDVVSVAGGYGRNYLIPFGKAARATKDKVKEIEAKREQLEQQDAEKRDEATKLAKELEGLKVTVIRQAREDGRLYGSVAVRDVVAELQEKGHDISRQQVNLGGAIKKLGDYTATILLHPEVSVDCKVRVARSEKAAAEAEAQEQAAGTAEESSAQTA